MGQFKVGDKVKIVNFVQQIDKESYGFLYNKEGVIIKKLNWSSTYRYKTDGYLYYISFKDKDLNFRYDGIYNTYKAYNVEIELVNDDDENQFEYGFDEKMKTKFNDFLNEKLGIAEPVVKLAKNIYGFIGDNKEFSIEIDTEDLEFPFNNLKKFTVNFGEDLLAPDANGNCEFDEKKMEYTINIRNLEERTLYHELDHLYKFLMIVSKGKDKDSVYSIISEYIKAEGIVFNEKDMLSVYLLLLSELLYYTSFEEKSARLIEVYEKLESLSKDRDLGNKTEFLEVLNKIDTFATYKNIAEKVNLYDKLNAKPELFNEFIDIVRYVIYKNTKNLLTESDVKKFIRRVDYNSKTQSVKFMKKCYKLFDFFNGDKPKPKVKKTKKLEKVKNVYKSIMDYLDKKMYIR